MPRLGRSRAPSSKNSTGAATLARTSCAPSGERSSSRSADGSGTGPVILRSNSPGLVCPNESESGLGLMRRSILLFIAAAVAVTPVAAQRLVYLDPQDVTRAQREHPQVVRELGGAETGPRAAYVESIGRRVAGYSGVANPGQALHFTLLNSAVENAFSVPGGYVYATRQLMTLMDDESGLAFALGHEVGHVAANHAHIREQYARRNSYGVLGSIIGAIFGGVGDLLQTRAKMDTLSFSREQEYQADSLGLRYTIAAGYDPIGGPEILAALSRQTALQGRVQGRSNRQTPEW